MSVAAVILAAGSSSRFGSTKQVVTLYGRPLVGHAVATARAAGCVPVVVVVGHDELHVRGALRRMDVRIVTNPAFAEGQSTSLAVGLAALGGHVEAAVVLLADQPGVTAEAVRACVAAWRGGAGVARAAYDDRQGHPIVFDRSIWPRLSHLSGDQGARQVLAELDVTPVPVPGPCPRDVDRPSDLAALESRPDQP